MSHPVRRRERAYLRAYAQRYARAFLGVERLPSGVPAIARAYADAIEQMPDIWDDTANWGYDGWKELARALMPYSKRRWFQP